MLTICFRKGGLSVLVSSLAPAVPLALEYALILPPFPSLPPSLCSSHSTSEGSTVSHKPWQGPASLLIDFLIIGIMMFNVVYALGELAVMYPVSGGFYTYSTRFIDPTWGFAMGWNYVMQWAIVLPLELTVCSLTVAYWNHEISHGII